MQQSGSQVSLWHMFMTFDSNHQNVSSLEKLKFNSSSSGLLFLTSTTSFGSVQQPNRRVLKSGQTELRESLQCSTERRVCCSGVWDPHHGQVTLPGDGRRAGRGVHWRPD
ncbi:hypothetical protein ATANTOWER_026631 [Ataeniobius toweri]|uniref:Uncharacterized protein n=1 Tax=Ataeniobius toweri TaxID=208326 RepID=A0ABU7BMF1_9TELE|nr:hypothetical protein [Ataeniobius toweri]